MYECSYVKFELLTELMDWSYGWDFLSLWTGESTHLKAKFNKYLASVYCMPQQFC